MTSNIAPAKNVVLAWDDIMVLLSCIRVKNKVNWGSIPDVGGIEEFWRPVCEMFDRMRPGKELAKKASGVCAWWRKHRSWMEGMLKHLGCGRGSSYCHVRVAMRHALHGGQMLFRSKCNEKCQMMMSTIHTTTSEQSRNYCDAPVNRVDV